MSPLKLTRNGHFVQAEEPAEEAPLVKFRCLSCSARLLCVSLPHVWLVCGMPKVAFVSDQLPFSDSMLARQHDLGTS